MVSKCPGAEELMEQACAVTGLHDFGDPARHTALRNYATSLESEAWPYMTPQARESAVDYFVHLLSTRLKLVEDRKKYPEITRQKITAPIIIIGPPRSGSTLLHTLISLDPDNSAVESWVTLEPSPPLALGPPGKERMKLAHDRLMKLFEPIPDVFIMHPYLIEEGASTLAECGSDILSMTFTSQQMWCLYRSEGYRHYLLEADHTAVMGFHHDFLQHIQWGNKGKRWSLKGSDHLLWLEELAGQYPDAMLIWTHRDLAQQLGSLASVQALLTGVTGNPVTGDKRKALARQATDHQCAAFEKGMRTRDKLGEERFMDISYHDVMANPMRTVERIYERFGLRLSQRHTDNIRQWLDNNHQTKHGVHKYSPKDFGLEADTINSQFSNYIERFGFGFGIRPPLTE